MSKPYFSEDYPLYIQMSGLGFMISHEIWHQFDTTGIKYDSEGHRDSKFSGASIAEIMKTADCLTDQANVTVTHLTNRGEEFSYRLNPAISLNERLVDIGGAHLAYKTALKFSNPDTNFKELPWTPLKPLQLFFLSLAQQFCTKATAFDYAVSMFEDEHLPQFLRVKNIDVNSMDFSEAFKCEASQKKRCLPFTVQG